MKALYAFLLLFSSAWSPSNTKSVVKRSGSVYSRTTVHSQNPQNKVNIQVDNKLESTKAVFSIDSLPYSHSECELQGIYIVGPKEFQDSLLNWLYGLGTFIDVGRDLMALQLRSNYPLIIIDPGLYNSLNQNNLNSLTRFDGYSLFFFDKILAEEQFRKKSPGFSMYARGYYESLLAYQIFQNLFDTAGVVEFKYSAGTLDLFAPYINNPFEPFSVQDVICRRSTELCDCTIKYNGEAIFATTFANILIPFEGIERDSNDSGIDVFYFDNSWHSIDDSDTNILLNRNNLRSKKYSEPYSYGIGVKLSDCPVIHCVFNHVWERVWIAGIDGSCPTLYELMGPFLNSSEKQICLFADSLPIATKGTTYPHTPVHGVSSIVVNEGHCYHCSPSFSHVELSGMIIHEFIHAEFFHSLYLAGYLPGTDYGKAWSSYLSSKFSDSIPRSYTQHQIMALLWIPRISTILWEINDKIASPHDYEYVAWHGLTLAFYDIPEVSVVPDEQTMNMLKSSYVDNVLSQSNESRLARCCR